LFSVGIFVNQVYASTGDTREELWHEIQQFVNEINNSPRIFRCLQVSLSRRVMSINMVTILRTSWNKVKTKRLLIALCLFSSYTQPVKLRKYSRCEHGRWN
jgi:hypothetical protein